MTEFNLHPVHGHPGWHLGLTVVTSDGSLLGHRRVVVHGPDGEAIEVESLDGSEGIQRAAVDAIVHAQGTRR